MSEQFISDGYELALCYLDGEKCTMYRVRIGAVVTVMNDRYNI